MAHARTLLRQIAVLVVVPAGMAMVSRLAAGAAALVALSIVVFLVRSRGGAAPAVPQHRHLSAVGPGRA